jgi:hypothetical protein
MRPTGVWVRPPASAWPPRDRRGKHQFACCILPPALLHTGCMSTWATIFHQLYTGMIHPVCLPQPVHEWAVVLQVILLAQNDKNPLMEV